MNLHEILTHKILSICFRIILILLSVFVIFYNENIFPVHWYLLSIIPYLAIYIFALFREGVYSKIRLINDFIFIGFIIYQKDASLDTLCLVLLPIINSPNHSGEKKSWLLYALTFITALFLNKVSLSFHYFITIWVIQLLGFIVDFRFNYFKKMGELSNHLDSSFSSLDQKKTYKIYDGIIDTLSKMRPLKLYNPKIQGIICFIESNGGLKLVNSSFFIWDYEILDLNEDKKNGLLQISRAQIVINKKRCDQNNIVITTKPEQGKYHFILQYEATFKSNDIFDKYYERLLQPIFHRISLLLISERRLRFENKSALVEIKNKIAYVQNAEKAMHFIKNKFTPLSNFIEMSEDYVNNEMDSLGQDIYIDELQRVKNNFNQIITRANNILKKKSNPFHVAELKTTSFKSIFGLIRTTWLDYYPKFEYELVKEDILTVDFNLNNDGFIMLIVDWLNNMSKYSNGNEKVRFTLSDDLLEISFINSVKNEENQAMRKLVSDFNSQERSEILKRKSHGLSIMKSLMSDMFVKGQMSLDNNQLILQLSIPINK